MKNNVDPHEIDKFNQISSEWWDVHGPFKALHTLNPCRVEFIQQHISLANKRLLDVGCGGGLLAESLAKAGARVTGIDMAPVAIRTAQTHADQQDLLIDYHLASAEAYAADHAGTFDCVTCMELLEHVPDPSSVVKACSQLVKPGGTVFFSTLNRTLKSFLIAIVGAEYLIKLVPRGTHHYRQFIKPSELDEIGRRHHLRLTGLKGIKYDPIFQVASLENAPDVNYIASFVR